MRYMIGIDLGTTNTSVAYFDTQDLNKAGKRAQIKSFKIPQLVSEGVSESLSSLPSFCYLSSKEEFSEKALDLPWKRQSSFFVGQFALEQGAKVPTRLVQSAKSWLCHPAANRRDKILPVEAADESARVSPLEATARYLRHIRQAWNHKMAKGSHENEFEEQGIVLTVPASFDEVARSLTVEAARMAGFDQMTLLEEPQAAFYSWIAEHEESWQKMIPVGSLVLVCDVGGGTTDFSLIEVVEKGGGVSFQRMAVGDHLLLGGDNMDAFVASNLETLLGQGAADLSVTQRLQLRHAARLAKETLLQEEKDGVSNADSYRVVLQGTGSGLVQGTRSVTLQGDLLRSKLTNGFFNQYSWQEALQLKKTAGIRSMGLPYENEASITKHLAHFLATSAGDDKAPKKPDFVLFNGGTMNCSLFQDAMMQALKEWFPEKFPIKLDSYNLDLAVARGAAYYGKVRMGSGVKIGGGVARGYYLLVDIKNGQGVIEKKALTLLPRGSEEGDLYEPAMTFQLFANTPVVFQLATSHVRLHDSSGDLIDIDPKEMNLLPPIQTILRFGKRQIGETVQEKVPVHVQIVLTPIGTLQVDLKSLTSEHQWALEFQLRSAGGQENRLSPLNARKSDETFSSDYLKEAVAVLKEFFSLEAHLVKLFRMMEKLEDALKMPRADWPPSLMRGLADPLFKLAPQRKNSAGHAERWWNLIGFLLRPGFGYPLDDFRIKELWKVILSDSKEKLPTEVSIQMWICYRRISGGLSKGQQLQLAAELMGMLLPNKTSRIEIKGKASAYLTSEQIRSLGSFELIDSSLKLRFGKALVARLCAGTFTAADVWALGRVGARHLLYGSLANVVSLKTVLGWIEQLLNAPLPLNEQSAFLFGQLARKTEHPEINIPKTYVDRILAHFSETPYEERLQELLLKENRLSERELDLAFGDHLPSGLLLEV